MKREDMSTALRRKIMTGLAIPLLASAALVGCGAGQDASSADQPSQSGSAAAEGGSTDGGVPAVRRASLSDAISSLEDAGYSVRVKGEEIENYEMPKKPEDWEVLGQNPAAGEEPEEGDLVELAVRKKGSDDGEQ